MNRSLILCLMSAMFAESLSSFELSLLSLEIPCWMCQRGDWLFSDSFSSHRADMKAFSEACCMLLCNLTASAVAGVIVSCERYWQKKTVIIGTEPAEPTSPSKSRESLLQVANALKLGYCSTLSSFPGAVEATFRFTEHQAYLLAAMSIFGGPALFIISARAAQCMLRSGILQVLARFRNISRCMLTVLACSIIGNIAVVQPTQLKFVEFLVGCAMVAAAMLLNEAASLYKHLCVTGAINWFTVATNIMALIFVMGHERYISVGTEGESTAFDMVSKKFRTSFCGTISAYSSFVEDVSVPLAFSGLQKGWALSMLNLTLNTLVGISALQIYMQPADVMRIDLEEGGELYQNSEVWNCSWCARDLRL